MPGVVCSAVIGTCRVISVDFGSIAGVSGGPVLGGPAGEE